MLSIGFPDWKKIGWHVGKKLGDVINPPADTGPSQEERRARRLRDGARGLVYFDDFDELDTWSAENVDPVQQANTPLLKRSASRVHDHGGPTSLVLLCHDYSGGYHDYESVRPSLLEDKMYACNYPQYVDTFVYFSHKLVCVPPPTWINTMHRNGVKVLGTFILEPGKDHAERMLDQVNGEFKVAKQLATLAEVFGFDGWLLNIELEFPKIIKDQTGKMCALIRSLKRLLGPGNVVWYDSFTTDNEVDYQNGLTPKNVPFALAADSLFTNYKWTMKKLKEAESTAERHELHPNRTFFGIDVWAQNTDMPGPPRITFPPKGGGGTNTGLATCVLAEAGFSTAIFGPAWTHEHFSTSARHAPSTAECVENAMWLAKLLPSELGCDCHGALPHHTREYMRSPIVDHAREFPAGSACFFQTDFKRAFEWVADLGAQSKKHIRSRLGSQGPLPHLLPLSVPDWKQASDGPQTRVLYGELPDESPGGIIVNTKIIGNDEKMAFVEMNSSGSGSRARYRLCLFKLNMIANRSLAATIRFTCLEAVIGVALGFYMGYTVSDSENLSYDHVGMLSSFQGQVQDKTIGLSFPTAGSRLVEFGVYGMGLVEDPNPLALCRILNLTIKPESQVESTWTVDHVRVMERGTSPYRDQRLAWNWSGSGYSEAACSPWSKTTGPFSYFDVIMGGKELGKAYCMEFPIHSEDFHGCEGKRTEVIIRGRLFGGSEIISRPMQLSRGEIGVA